MGFLISNEQFTERRNKKRRDPFHRSFNSVIYLFSRLILIGYKEIASWLSESEGVSDAEARVITATLEIENHKFTSFHCLVGDNLFLFIADK